MYRKLTTVAAVAALAFGLAACGGGGSDSTQTAPPVVDPAPTPVETATAGIAAATTAEEAQAAYDAVKDDVTATQGDMLQAAVDARIMALATMARADAQKTALMTAAAAIDTSDLSTQEAVDAARAAIAALRGAIDAAVDVADKSMYESQLAAATMDVDEAQGGIETATRRTNQMAALSGVSLCRALAVAACVAVASPCGGATAAPTAPPTAGLAEARALVRAGKPEQALTVLRPLARGRTVHADVLFHIGIAAIAIRSSIRAMRSCRSGGGCTAQNSLTKRSSPNRRR